MPNNITYRRAKNSDAAIIKNILQETFKEYKILLPPDYSFADVEQIEKYYNESNGEFVVLLQDNTIIGFFGLVPVDDHFLELKRLYITKSERGKRLGQYLLDLAVRTAQKTGCRGLQLETSSRFIEAISLYKKNGFSDRAGAQMAAGHDIALIKYL